jgi:hypothetical protein
MLQWNRALLTFADIHLLSRLVLHLCISQVSSSRISQLAVAIVSIIEALLQIVTRALGEPRETFGIGVRHVLSRNYLPLLRESEHAPEITQDRFGSIKFVNH